MTIDGDAATIPPATFTASSDPQHAAAAALTTPPAAVHWRVPLTADAALALLDGGAGAGSCAEEEDVDESASASATAATATDDSPITTNPSGPSDGEGISSCHTLTGAEDTHFADTTIALGTSIKVFNNA